MESYVLCVCVCVCDSPAHRRTRSPESERAQARVPKASTGTEAAREGKGVVDCEWMQKSFLRRRGM